MAGRLAGFARELLLASVFGLSAQADVVIVLLTLPDLLVNLLLSGGLSVALVPALSGQDSARKVRLFAQASLVVSALFTALALCFVWQPALWLGLLAPGVKLQTIPLSSLAWFAVSLALPFTALSGVSSAALNAEGRFFIAGCGTLIFNLCVIAALLLGLRAPTLGAEALLLAVATGIAIGSLLRWFSQLFALDHGYRAHWRACRPPWLLDQALLRTFVAGLASASLLILMPVLIRAFASWLGPGQLAAFNYAIKLVELPLGILVTPLATVAYPRLSEAYQTGNDASFDDLFHETLWKTILLAIIVVLCGWQFSDLVVMALMGKLDAQEQAHVVALTQRALLSVPFVGLAGLAAAALNARKRAGDVLRCCAIALLSLPLWCLPGLLAASAHALMWALPAAQFVLVMLLFRTLSLPPRPGVRRSARKMLVCLGAVTLPCMAGAWLDSSMQQVLDRLPVGQLLMARVLLLTCVFLVAAAAGMRALRFTARDE